MPSNFLKAIANIVTFSGNTKLFAPFLRGSRVRKVSTLFQTFRTETGYLPQQMTDTSPHAVNVHQNIASHFQKYSSSNGKRAAYWLAIKSRKTNTYCIISGGQKKAAR